MHGIMTSTSEKVSTVRYVVSALTVSYSRSTLSSWTEMIVRARGVPGSADCVCMYMHVRVCVCVGGGGGGVCVWGGGGGGGVCMHVHVGVCLHVCVCVCVCKEGIDYHVTNLPCTHAPNNESTFSNIYNLIGILGSCFIWLWDEDNTEKLLRMWYVELWNWKDHPWFLRQKICSIQAVMWLSTVHRHPKP